jgi:multicomponent Na+:H+ antiporter subunit B
MILIRNIIQSLIISGVISAIAVFIYLLLAAPDLAITEAVIGIGANSIIFILALFVIKKMKSNNYSKIFLIDINASKKMILSYLLCITIIAIFMYIISIIPNNSLLSYYGNNTDMKTFYITNSYKDFGFESIVTSIVVGYRGFDTLLENLVILCGGIGFVASLSDLNNRISE